MAAPAVLGSEGAAAASDQLVGVVVTFAVIGFGEAARAARWVNVPLGIWLLLAPWALSDVTPSARWNDLAVGAAVILLVPTARELEGRGAAAA